MVQIVKHSCCGAIFAACHEPHCYTDSEWTRNLKKYIKAGDKVEMVDGTSFKFSKCTCSQKKESAQLSLFENA